MGKQKGGDMGRKGGKVTEVEVPASNPNPSVVVVPPAFQSSTPTLVLVNHSVGGGGGGGSSQEAIIPARPGSMVGGTKTKVVKRKKQPPPPPPGGEEDSGLGLLNASSSARGGSGILYYPETPEKDTSKSAYDAKRRKEDGGKSTSTTAAAAASVLGASSENGLATEWTGRGGRPALLPDCLKCTGCQELAASPIHTCKEGHKFCFLCYEKLPSSPKTCPSCPSEILQLNCAVEQIVNWFEYKLTCPNVGMGCRDGPLMSFELKQHLLHNCFFRDVLCADSNTAFKFNEWADHLRRHRGISQFVWDNGRELSLAISTSSGVLDCAGTKLFGNDFILRMQLTDSIYYVWMAIMGGENEAKKYIATISLNGIQNWPGNKVTASWTIPVIPYHDLAAMEKTEASFGSMTRKIFESATTFNQTHSVYWFKITVEIAVAPHDFEFAKKN